MTGGAGDILVRALQGKPRLAMIEGFRITPLHDRMAVIAPFAEPAAMWIDLPVTFKTGRWSLAEFDFWSVAALAGHALVGVDKFIVGRIVVECFSIELVDVGSAAFVVSMTLFAFPLQRLRLPAMDTTVRHTIGGDVLVTVQAKFRLRVPREWFVTFSALPFQLGVPFDHRPRHHQLFQQALGIRVHLHAQHADARKRHDCREPTLQRHSLRQ